MFAGTVFAAETSINLNQAYDKAVKNSSSIKLAEQNVIRAANKYSKVAELARDANAQLMEFEGFKTLLAKEGKTKEDLLMLQYYTETLVKKMNSENTYNLTVIRDVNPMFAINDLNQVQYKLEMEQNKVKDDVTKLYVSVLTIPIEKEKEENILKNLQDKLFISKGIYKFGMVSELDIKQLEMSIEIKQNEINDLEKSLILSKKKLNNLIGETSDKVFSSYTDIDIDKSILVLKTFGGYLESANRNRKEVELSKNQFDAVTKEYELTEKKFSLKNDLVMSKVKNKLEQAKLDFESSKSESEKLITTSYDSFKISVKTYNDKVKACENVKKSSAVGALKLKFALITDSDLDDIKLKYKNYELDKQINLYSAWMSYRKLLMDSQIEK